MVALGSKIIVEHFAHWLDGLHHQHLDVGVGLHFLQQSLQHQVLLFQFFVFVGLSFLLLL